MKTGQECGDAEPVSENPSSRGGVNGSSPSQDGVELRSAAGSARVMGDLLSKYVKHSPIYSFIKEVSPTESRVLMASENYKDMIGIAGSEMVGKRMDELFPPEFAAKITADDWKVASQGVSIVLDEDLNGRNYTTYKFPIAHGNRTFLAGYTIDITDRKRAEEDLRSLNRQLKEALGKVTAMQQEVMQQERLRALGTMASGIAHDFNNALMPIQGLSELLLTRRELREDPGDLQACLKTIHGAACDAAAVVKRLREFYRTRSENEALTDVDINGVVEQTVELTKPKWRGQCQARGVTVVVRTELGVLPRVRADPASLREALTNLIFNAVDAMPQGGEIVLRTRQASRGGPKSESWDESDRVLLEVVDTGEGMTEDVRRRCLDPFFSTKGDDGSGLGLAMVYGTMQRLGGSIEVESEKGCGTTVRLSLPLSKGIEPARLSAPSDLAPQERLRILVVDNEMAIRTTIGAILRNHTLVLADDGRNGLEEFCKGQFDLVITDQSMPRMSGEQLAVAVKQRSPKTPIILLTGFGDIMQVSDERPSGVDLVLSKPVRAKDLRQAIVQVMGGEAHGSAKI